MHPNEIKALLNLLDDPDENIYHEVRNRFLELGNEVIPYLENLWETSYEPIIQERVESIIHELQIRQTKTKVKIDETCLRAELFNNPLFGYLSVLKRMWS